MQTVSKEPDNIVTGHYDGNGVNNRVIHLGFHPKSVMVHRRNSFGTNSEANIAIRGFSSNAGGVVIVDNGFMLTSGTGGYGNFLSNDYNFAAFR
jgi:hypothetical protein